MKRFYQVLCAAACIVALIEGVWIWRLTHRDEVITAQPETKIIELTPVAQKEERTEAPVQSTEAVAARVETTAQMAPPMRVFDRDWALTKDLAQAVGISDYERSQVNDLLNGVRVQLGSLVAAHATVTSLPNGRVMVDIQPFVEEGRQVYDDFVKALDGMIGTERSQHLLGQGGDQIERVFGHFGACSRGVMVRRVQNPDGSLSYSVNEEYQTGAGSGSSGGSYRNLESLAKRFIGIADLLPPEMGPGE